MSLEVPHMMYPLSLDSETGNSRFQRTAESAERRKDKEGHGKTGQDRNLFYFFSFYFLCVWVGVVPLPLQDHFSAAHCHYPQTSRGSVGFGTRTRERKLIRFMSAGNLRLALNHTSPQMAQIDFFSDSPNFSWYMPRTCDRPSETTATSRLTQYPTS